MGGFRGDLRNKRMQSSRCSRDAFGIVDQVTTSQRRGGHRQVGAEQEDGGQAYHKVPGRFPLHGSDFSVQRIKNPLAQRRVWLRSRSCREPSFQIIQFFGPVGVAHSRGDTFYPADVRLTHQERPIRQMASTGGQRVAFPGRSGIGSQRCLGLCSAMSRFRRMSGRRRF